MRLIETMRSPDDARQADIYEMPASGYTVFLFKPGSEDQREGFVFDTERDARQFASRETGAPDTGDLGGQGRA